MTLVFPVLDSDDRQPWAWPLPSFVGLHVVVPRNDVAQPCEVQTLQDTTLQGEMLAFDPEQRTLHFSLHTDGARLALPFERLRRLRLTRPLAASPRALGGPAWRAPLAEEERAYRLSADGLPPLTGQTLGHIETGLGMFLYEPTDDDRSVLRLFVPAAAYRQAEFGLSAADEAARHWITTRPALAAALAQQGRTPVRPIGESLLALGLVTPRQLQRALAEVAGTEQPLGEHLVAQRLITAEDLQTALAHKMGHPIVDAAAFPIDPQAAARVSLRQIAQARALPLMEHDGALVVAVERLARMNGLKPLQTAAGMPVLPVLAFQAGLRSAFAALLEQGVWRGAWPHEPDVTADVFAPWRG